MNANVPPGLSQRRTMPEECVEPVARHVAQPEAGEDGVDARGPARPTRRARGGGPAARARRNRSRARSSGAGAPSYSDSSPLEASSGDHQPVPAASSTISPWIGSASSQRPGRVELRIPGGVVDGPARVAAAAQVPVVVLGRAGLVVGEHLGVDVGSGGAAAARAGGRPAVAARATASLATSAARPSRPPRPRSVSACVQPEPEEAVVAGLADAVRAELRPALQVVATAAGVRAAAPQAVEGRAERHAGGYGSTGVQEPGGATSTNACRIEDLGQQLDAVDHPRARPAEVGRSVQGEDLVAADRRQLPVPGRTGESAPTRSRSRRRWKPHGISRSISGSTSAIASQSVWTDGSPSAPRRSQPPARRICSGTQWPDGERRIEPFEPDHPRRSLPAARDAPGPAARSRRAARAATRRGRSPCPRSRSSPRPS